MDVADVLKSLRQHWRISVAIMVVAVLGLGAFLVMRKNAAPEKRYRVSSDIAVPAVDKKGNSPAGVPVALLQGQGNLALQPSTIRRALRKAKVPERDRAMLQFGVSINESGDTVTLGAIAPTADEASKAAKGFRSAFIGARRDVVAANAAGAEADARAALTKLTSELTQNTASLNRLDRSLLSTVATLPSGAIPIDGLSPATSPDVVLLVVERNALISHIGGSRNTIASNVIASELPQAYAQVASVSAPAKISSGRSTPLIPAALALGVGLVLALAAPILLDRMDKSIRTPRAASFAFDAAVLTSVPALPRRMQRALVDPGTRADGAYRALAATSIATDRMSQAILVMSPTGTAQDMVAANYAAALAGLGLRVTLIATDERQAWFVDPDAQPLSTEEGVLTFPELLDLAHRGRLNGALTRGLVRTRHPNLLVVPPGPFDADATLDGLRPLLEALHTAGVDVTVIAGPALLEDPAATILAWTTRSVLWAFRTGEVTEAEAREAATRLTMAGAESFGIALVGGKG